MADKKALEKIKDFETALLEDKTALLRLLPKNEVIRFVQIALNQINENPNLASCRPKSFAIACLKCAALKLEPSFGLVYFVPYKGEVKLQIGYQGMAELAMRHPDVLLIDAHVVREGEIFSAEYGTSPHINHVPDLSKCKNKLVAAYAVVWLHNAPNPKFVVVGKEDVEKARDHSPMDWRKSIMWSTFPEWGWMKVAVKHIMKLTPKSVEYQHVEKYDNNNAIKNQRREREYIEIEPNTVTTFEEPLPHKQKKAKAEAAADPDAIEKAELIAEIKKLQLAVGKETYFEKLEQLGIFAGKSLKENSVDALVALKEALTEGELQI